MKNLLLIVGFGAMLLACETKSQKTEPDPESLRSSVKPTSVKITKAEVKPFDYLVHATGKLQAAKTVTIKFKTTGQLEQLNIFDGKKVNKGTVLAKLNDDQEQLALKKASADLEQKKFEYESELMSFSLDKMSEERAATIQKSIKHSSGLAQAELNQEDARLQLAYTRLKAPFDGIVANLETQQRSYVNAGDKLCDIYTPGQLEVTSFILEGDLAEIDLGDKAQITPLESNLSTEAVVAEINPQVDENGLVKITLKITGKTYRLIPGMNTEVLIKVPKEKNIVIPKEAVVIRSGKAVVFVAEENRAKWHYVTIGLDNGKEVEILEGLKPDAAVIITNNLQLAHDALVDVE